MTILLFRIHEFIKSDLIPSSLDIVSSMNPSLIFIDNAINIAWLHLRWAAEILGSIPECLGGEGNRGLKVHQWQIYSWMTLNQSDLQIVLIPCGNQIKTNQNELERKKNIGRICSDTTLDPKLKCEEWIMLSLLFENGYTMTIYIVHIQGCKKSQLAAN